MRKKMICSTWLEFDECCKNKQVVLFGASIHSQHLFCREGKKYKIECVVDNDERKQGLLLKDVVGECGENGSLVVMAPESLRDTYNPNEVVVCVASVHFIDIKMQLEGMGFFNVVSILEIQKHEGFDGRYAYADKYANLCVKKKKIVMIMSFYGDHAKYITYALMGNPDIDIVWCVKSRRGDTPENVRSVNEANWGEYFGELETARIVMYDNTLPNGFKKREGQIVIFVKHWASITLKKFFLEDKMSCAVPESVTKMKIQSGMTDYILSGSAFDEKALRNGMQYQGNFVRVGSPRSDVLFSKGVREKICERFAIPKEDKMLLYAPTFRRDEREEDKEFVAVNKWQGIDLIKIRNVLEDKYDVKWHVIVKLHPMIAVSSMSSHYGEEIIDASRYDDVQELLAASDILITDYSSVMFEPAFVGKPVYLFAPDKEHYISEERDLLIDYDTLPFPISKTNEELITQIEQFDEDNYRNDVKRFLQKYGVHEDGHASERAAAFIMELMEK